MNLFHRRRRNEEELDAEIRSHLEMSVRHRIERGESPDGARANALREFGNVGLIKDVTREMWGWASFERLVQDLRFGLRMVRKNPGFTSIAVLTLALGIGANTAIFSLINTVLLRPLPVSEPERLVEIAAQNNGAIFGLSYPYYRDFRDQNDVMEGLIAFRFAPMSLSQNGNNLRLWGYLVSGNYFEVLGVRAIRGRMFTQREDLVPDAHPVAVISYQCWQSRFGGDPNLVGKTITINNHSFTVVGVAPSEFSGTALIFTPEIYVPIMMAKQIQPGSNWLERRNNNVLFVQGRLKPNVAVAQAKAQFDALAVQFGREHPGYEKTSFILSPPGLILPALRDGALSFAGVLLAIVGLVLLIACTNLANLLLARAGRRRKEIAVRLALGASRWRLIRQLLTESLMLALAGGVAGMLLAWWLVGLTKAFKPPMDFALTIDLRIDWRVLLFSFCVSLLTGLLFGLLPAWQSTKPDLTSALKDESGSGGSSRAPLRNGLVIAQVAMSLVLLAGAGLIVRSLQQVQMVGPGFEVEHLMTASVDLNLQGYNDRARGLRFYKQLLARVETLPGVQSVSLTGILPLNLDNNSSLIYAEGQPFTRHADLTEIQQTAVWTRYFETAGIPLLEGRDFTPQDENEGTRVIIINESLARRFWPGQSAIGKRLSQGGPDRPFFEIVGVVKDSKYWSISEDPRPFIYFPMMRNYDGDSWLLVRSTGAPESLIAAIRHEVQQLDPNLPLFDTKTMQQHMRLALLPLRAGAWVAGSFALLALGLTGLGIYGVMSYAVSQRTRELGIRVALGAKTRDVLWLVIKQGLVLVSVGLGVGLAGALALTRLMASVLVGVSTTDAATFVSVTLLLTLIVSLACYLPARRATRVNPLIALRYE
jgi:macrolide transport system ATP-binding/permease protein